MPKISKKQKIKNSPRKGEQAILTSAKARFISVPTQRILADRCKTTPTTKRKLTFADLTAHTNHHSAGVRNEAILGLRELLEAYPELLSASLTSLLEACARMICDKDANVRQTLLSFVEWLLPRIPKETLHPHFSLLFLFISAAQTHIFPDIRTDALRFLDTVVKHIPRSVMKSWSGRHETLVLEGFLRMLKVRSQLGKTHDSTASALTTGATISLTSKLTVLRSLSNFLHHTLPFLPAISTDTHSSSSASTWFLTLFPNEYSPEVIPHKSWIPVIEPGIDEDARTWQGMLASEPFEKPWTFRQLSDVVSLTGKDFDASTSSMIDLDFVADLARTLHHTLMSAILDCTSTMASCDASLPEVEVDLIDVVEDIIQGIYGTIFHQSVPKSVLHDQAYKDLMSLLECISPCFPFRNYGHRDLKREQTFQNMNITFCGLTSLLVISGDDSSHSKLQDVKDSRLSIQLSRIGEYIIELLSECVERPLTSAAYISLLPAMWSFLHYPSQPSLSSRVLHAGIRHAINVSSMSTTLKEATVKFVAGIVLYDTRLRNDTFRNHCDGKLVQEWIIHLPHILLQLGSNNLQLTKTTLRFLLQLFQRKSMFKNQEVISCVRSRLVPYFSITNEFPGSYIKLPNSATRILVLDVVTTLSFADVGDDGLEVAVDQAVTGTAEWAYWVHLRSTSGHR